MPAPSTPEALAALAAHLRGEIEKGAQSSRPRASKAN